MERFNFTEFGFQSNIFHGVGMVKLDDDSQIDAEFAVMQQEDGRMVFKAYFDSPPWEYLNRIKSIKKIIGTLSDGRLAILGGPFFLKNSSLTSTPKGGFEYIVSGYPTNCEFGDKNFQKASYIVFDLVNCLFMGTEVEETRLESGDIKEELSLLSLNIDERNVKLRRVSEYKQIEAILLAKKDVRITSTVESVLHSWEEIEDTVLLIDGLCSLLSVAKGTLINWLSYTIYNENGTVPVYSFYYNSVTRNFSGMAPIQELPAQNLKLFLENGFKRFNELDQDFNIKRISSAYVETRSGSFLETRSMLIGVLAEYLANVRSNLEQRDSLMDDEEFKLMLPYIEDGIKRGVEGVFNGTEKNKRKGLRYKNVMLGKLKDLNRRPLSWKLERLVKWLEVNVTNHEIKEFILTRDTLVHTGKFPPDQVPATCWTQALHLLDRVILRFFDYRGQYYDIQNNKISEL